MRWAGSTTGATDGTAGTTIAMAVTPTAMMDTSMPGIVIDAFGIDTITGAATGAAIIASIAGTPESIESTIGGAQVTPIIIAGTSTIAIEPTTKAWV